LIVNGLAAPPSTALNATTRDGIQRAGLSAVESERLDAIGFLAGTSGMDQIVLPAFRKPDRPR
jgi:hypothetical protein